jgi:hypothetical protein
MLYYLSISQSNKYPQLNDQPHAKAGKITMDYPYSLSAPRIEQMLHKIRATGVPARVDTKWLKSVGFKSGNDSRLIGILQAIGFIDASKTPTEVWKRYRGDNSGLVLANAVRDGYSDLFHTYPNANEISDTDVSSFIRSNSNYAESTVNLATRTFKALVSQADFQSASGDSPRSGNVSTPKEPVEETLMPTVGAPKDSALIVNLNVQLSLPESTDPSVYDALFASMRRHLLTQEDQ